MIFIGKLLTFRLLKYGLYHVARLFGLMHGVVGVILSVLIACGCYRLIFKRPKQHADR